MDRYTEDRNKLDDEISELMSEYKKKALSHFDEKIAEDLVNSLIYAQSECSETANKVLDFYGIGNLEILAVLQDFQYFKEEYLSKMENEIGEAFYE